MSKAGSAFIPLHQGHTCTGSLRGRVKRRIGTKNTIVNGPSNWGRIVAHPIPSRFITLKSRPWCDIYMPCCTNVARHDAATTLCAWQIVTTITLILCKIWKAPINYSLLSAIEGIEGAIEWRRTRRRGLVAGCSRLPSSEERLQVETVSPSCTRPPTE